MLRTSVVMGLWMVGLMATSDGVHAEECPPGAYCEVAPASGSEEEGAAGEVDDGALEDGAVVNVDEDDAAVPTPDRASLRFDVPNVDATPERKTRRSKRADPRVMALVAVGSVGGAALLAGTIMLGVGGGRVSTANERLHTYPGLGPVDDCGGQPCGDFIADRERAETVEAVGAGVLLGGVTLVLVGYFGGTAVEKSNERRRRKRSAQVVPMVSPTQVGMMVTAQF